MAFSLKKAEKALRELGVVPAARGFRRDKRRFRYLARFEGATTEDRESEHAGDRRKDADAAALLAFSRDVRGLADGRARLWRMGEAKEGRPTAQALLKDVTVTGGKAKPTPTLLEG